MSAKRNFSRGSLYHVFSRGSRKGLLFIDFQDYEFFLIKANFYNIKFGNKIVQYVLMPNHYHFVIKAKNKLSIPRFMHSLNTSYAMKFCKKYAEVGSVYQGRYRAKKIDSLNFLVWVSRYIHLNPVGLGLNKEELLKYPWSSLKEFLSDSEKEGLVKIEKMQVLKYFKNIKSYRQFLLLSDQDAKDRVAGLGVSCDLI